MSDDKGQVVKVYVTDRPRFLGIFHLGPSVDGVPGITGKIGPVGIIGHIGPCRCSDPTHTFPRFYSVTPCIYVRGFDLILTIRIPGWLASAILWVKGPSEV